jgi:hypothetical protein
VTSSSAYAEVSGVAPRLGYARRVPAKGKPKTPATKRFSLYWVTTEDGSEDCFVVAASANAAARFLEQHDGYDPDDADAEHVVDLPADLQNGTGWREAPSGKFAGGAAYAEDALVIACGGVIAKQRTDADREVLGELVKDFRFGSRHFRPGDVITTVKRELGVPEPARLAAFEGEKSGPSFPAWWEWELELTPHVEKRMEDRGFNEVELRAMLERATGFRPDEVEDRFLIETRFKGKPWEIVVEPDETDHLLVVVTAYGVDR